MLKLADRVKETSITVGNGLQIALSGAFGAFQTFASTIGDGNSTYYTIENNNNFEVGVGTYNANNNTLSRDLVLSSTNNNQRISLDGVSIVFCCYPASQAVLLDNGRINSPSSNYSGIVFPSSTVIDTALLSGIVSTSILPTSVVYSNDSRLSDNRNPNPHSHSISDITALQNALDSKQPTGSYASSVHSHVVSDVQNLQSLLDGKQSVGSYAASVHSHTSSQITDFAAAVSSVAPPTTNAELLTTGILSDDRLSHNIVKTSDSRLSDARTPVTHSHSIGDIANLQSSLDSKQASGNYALSSHQHIIADVSGLQSALNNKQASGSYASSTHTHLASDITDFASAVNTYAPPTVDASLLTTGVLSDNRLSNNIVRTTDARLSDARTPLSHNHNILDVSGLQTALDSKQASGNYAASSHTHIISSVSGLQSALDGKQASGNYAALSHTHTASNITDFNSSVSGLISGIYAPLSSPTLTGVPLAPTASSGTNTNQIASTSFVRTEISNLVASAPSTLDTLNELATALGNDPNFATTVTNNLASKAALSGATFTGSISSPSGSFTSSLKVNNTDVSLNGHVHNISDISGLQTSLDSKQPSGSYAALSHNHLIADVTGLQTALDGKQASGSYAASSHTHTSSSITDFSSSVNSLVNGIYAPLSGASFTGGISATSGNFPSGINIVSSSGSIYTSGNNLYFVNSGAGSTIFISDGGATGNILAKYADSSASAFMRFRKYRGSYASPLPSVSGDNITTLSFETPISDGTLATCAYIQATTEATPASGQTNVPTKLRFFTATSSSASTSPSERMTITSNGYVGINKTIPTSILDVAGLITANSGNFINSLQVNGTGVSISGHSHIIADVTGLQSALDGKQASGSYAASSHTHTASQITDFNSSVSGLLPTIANSGDNRILTSTGSSLGINAESGLTFDGSTLNIDANLSFDSFTESVVAIGNSSTSKTLDLTLGTVQTCTLTGNCTFTMPTATAGKSFTLFLNTGAGNFTSTFTGVKWSASTAPTITTTASKVDIISFISDGSFWYGSYSQNY